MSYSSNFSLKNLPSSQKNSLNSYKKRNIDLLQRNYLIRRILSPNIEKNNEYEKNSVYIIF